MDDGGIIKLLFDRSEQALTEISEKYGAKCYSVAYGVLRNRQDAEEVVSDAYMTVWNNVPPNKPAILCAYLYKTVRNLALLRYNAEKADKRRANSLAAPLSELNDCVPSGFDLQEECEGRELGEIINRFLLGLPELDRGMFVCRYFSNMEYKEIAEKYGFKQSRVKMTLYRSRAKLKETLIKEGYLSEK